MWDAIKTRITDEPVLTLALIEAALALAVGFGLGWTAEQVSMVVAFSAALLGWVARGAVTPLARPRNDEGVQLVPVGKVL